MSDHRTISRHILAMALRRKARGTGSSDTFLNTRTAVQSLPNLHQLFAGFPWLLVGGFATRAYMPERMTLDVDVLISAADATAVRDALLAAGYQITGHRSIGGFTAAHPTSMPIDVLTSTAPWLDQALRQPYTDAAGFPVLARPYLMLMKLQKGRSRDYDDVQRMLRDTPLVERQSTRDVIKRYASDLVEDLDSLIQLANLEFGPPHA